VSGERKKANEANEKYQKVLTDLNLPGALDALEADVAIPKETWTKMEEIRRKGGLSTLKQIAMHLKEVSTQANEASDSIEEILKVNAHWILVCVFFFPLTHCVIFDFRKKQKRTPNFGNSLEPNSIAFLQIKSPLRSTRTSRQSKNISQKPLLLIKNSKTNT
jgi:hypothetical protein